MNPNPKVIKVEVVEVDSSAIIGNMLAQGLHLEYSWAVTVETKSKPTASAVNAFEVRDKPHPYPPTKEYPLKEYKNVFYRY